MFEQIVIYFSENAESYWEALFQHLFLSFQALVLVLIIGFSLGCLAYQIPKLRFLATGLTQGLRVIPSLGVLFFLIPFIGVGRLPALVALVILGLPPIVINTLVGLVQVPAYLLETAIGLGMTQRQVMTQLALPLALPYILTGVKLALVEIMASATLATYIGAGGLGNLIFTGLGLYRMDLLFIGGASVAGLSLLAMISLDLLISRLVTHRRDLV